MNSQAGNANSNSFVYLSAEDNLRQNSTLLYCMGEEVENTLNSTPTQIARSMIELLTSLTVSEEECHL